MRHAAIGVLFLFIWHTCCYSQHDEPGEEVVFMFYNTENLFDAENDSLTSDDEFTPEGSRRWNEGRIWKKANRIAKVILAAGGWNAPAFIGLCEVESYEVLDLLVRKTPLSAYRYKVIHKDSPDSRGIDVAFIYRPEVFKPFDYQAIALKDSSNPGFDTRDILRISGILNNWDTLHVFVNHWPSRYGGLMETIGYRKLAAKALDKSVQEVFVRFPKAKIICMGDFNDTPEDESLSVVLKARKTDRREVQGEMINLSWDWMSLPVQTLKNMYSWQVFDQWIVSDYLTGNTVGMRFTGAEIFAAPFLLEPDKKYGGFKPKRTYVGFKHQEGFSDHLPIILRCRMSGL
ncbi:MAG TPA: endonuclease [Prolixibacteraceae bacterium]|nr:endonuclease [Prolixibacteraceae bacterium]